MNEHWESLRLLERRGLPRIHYSGQRTGLGAHRPHDIDVHSGQGKRHAPRTRDLENERPGRRPARPSLRESGQDLVEYALVLPVFFLLVLGIVEFAIVMWSYDTIANAAREGARAGIVYPYDLNNVETIVRSRALGLDQGALGVTAVQDTDKIRVTVGYSLTLMTGPLIEAVGGDPVMRLGTVATMRIE